MHAWGDDDVDWDGINDAVRYMVKNLRRYGRITVTGKEKWGCVRMEIWTYGFSITKFLCPGYLYSPLPIWLLKIDDRLAPVWRYVNRYYIPYQKFIYKFFLKRAIKKWPHLEKEILDGWNSIEEYVEAEL